MPKIFQLLHLQSERLNIIVRCNKYKKCLILNCPHFEEHFAWRDCIKKNKLNVCQRHKEGGVKGGVCVKVKKKKFLMEDIPAEFAKVIEEDFWEII